jgi:hypothetical protein
MPSSRVAFALSFALVVVCSSASGIRAQGKDLTVEDYCRVTISLMQLSVDEWQERVPVAEKIKTDRKKLETGLQAVTKKYVAQRSEALRQFGMDQQSFLRYTTDHKAEIDSYLEDNPEVQQAIDDLQKQIDKLIDQFESLASPKGAGK